MEFKGVYVPSTISASTSSSFEVGDVILIGSNPGEWYLDDGGLITSTSTNAAVAISQGQEFIVTGFGTGGKCKWEMIGDQDVDKVLLGNKAQIGSYTFDAFGLAGSIILSSDTGPELELYGTSSLVTESTGITTTAAYLVTAKAVAGYVPAKIDDAINALDSGIQSTSNGVWVSVKQTDGKIVGVSVKTNLVATSAIATSTSNQHSVTVSTVNGQVKNVYVTAPAPFTAADIGSSVLTSISGATTVTVSTLNGNVSKVVVAAPTRFAVSEIGDGTSESTSNGTTVKVSTHYGKVTAVTVTAPNTATNQTVVSTVNNVGVSVTGNIVNVSAIGFGAAAQKGVLAASGSFKTNNYSNSLPTASAVAAYADGVVAAAISGLDSTVSSNHDGMSLTVTETDGKLTSCAVGFYWLDASNNVIA